MDDLSIYGTELRPTDRVGRKKVEKDDLDCGLVEMLSGEPGLVPVAPAGAGPGIVSPLTQREALDALPGDPAIGLEVFAGANELSQRFFCRCGNPDGGEFTSAVKTSEGADVRTVGLHPHAYTPSHKSGSDDFAVHPQRDQKPVGVIPGCASFIADLSSEGSPRRETSLRMTSEGFGITFSSGDILPGLSAATTIASLCTSSPMCVMLSIRVLRVWLSAMRGQSTIYADGPAISS